MIKPEVVEVFVKKLKITCPHCSHDWLSESQADKRICCPKCKTSIMLAPGSSLQQREEQRKERISFRLASLVPEKELSEVGLLKEIQMVATAAEKFRQRSKIPWLPDWARKPREDIAQVLDEMVAFETKLVHDMYHQGSSTTINLGT
jgi:hypothetical protein